MNDLDRLNKHNEMINDIMIYQKYGYHDVCELYIGRFWNLINKEYISFGNSMSLLLKDKEIKQENPFFVKNKKGKRYAEVMDIDGTIYDIELNSTAILYTYVSDVNCCLEDKENQFVKSYDCKFWILEKDNELYIPRYYGFEEVYRKKNIEDIDLDVLISSIHFDSIQDLDEEMLVKLINSLCSNNLEKIAEEVESECGDKTFNDAVLFLKNNLLSYHFSEIKIINGLINDLQKEYIETMNEEIFLEEEMDYDYEEIDEDYMESNVWFSIKRLNRNNLIIITMNNLENPYEKIRLKLVSKKKYHGRQDILLNAFNSLCFSLVFENQCWFPEYEV